MGDYCRRTEIMCPNCTRKKLMESNNERFGYELWCDECGTAYEKVGESGVKFK